MRFAGIMLIGSVVTALAAGTAYADGTGHNMGSSACQPIFACGNASQQDLPALASRCSASGLGATADFSDTYPDSSGCMSVKVGDNGKMSTSSVCCVVPVPGQSDNCQISCSLMLY